MKYSKARKVIRHWVQNHANDDLEHMDEQAKEAMRILGVKQTLKIYESEKKRPRSNGQMFASPDLKSLR